MVFTGQRLGPRLLGSRAGCRSQAEDGSHRPHPQVEPASLVTGPRPQVTQQALNSTRRFALPSSRARKVAGSLTIVKGSPRPWPDGLPPDPGGWTVPAAGSPTAATPGARHRGPER